jgi:hypothetical protein
MPVGTGGTSSGRWSCGGKSPGRAGDPGDERNQQQSPGEYADDASGQAVTTEHCHHAAGHSSTQHSAGGDVCLPAGVPALGGPGHRLVSWLWEQ